MSAREFPEIYDSLIAEKNNQTLLNGLQPTIDDGQTLLNDLNSPSKVDDWRLWLAVVAFGTMVLEKFFDLFKSDIEKRAKEVIPSTSAYLADRLRNFQLGDDLVWNGKRYDYAIDNPAIKIIKYVAVVEAAGQVRIKVAKEGSGGPEKLDSVTEVPAVDAYSRLILPPGTNRVLQSSDPDYITQSLNIYYNPLVLASDGSLVSNPAVFPVEDAINNYLKSLPFNGKLKLNDYVDAIQKAAGVTNPIVNMLMAKYGSLSYQYIFDEYVPDAGYLIVDPSTPLNATITYTADV